MSHPRHAAELGRLVDRHRPVSPWGGLAATAVLPILIAVLPAISLGPVVGAAFLIGFWIPAIYAMGEILFLEHRIHEHGLVLRSLPGLRTYVIPHYTVDPDTVTVGGRGIDTGGKVVVDRAMRASRLAPGTIWFTGLDPAYAHKLAKGKLDWNTAGDDYDVRDGERVWVPRPDKRWAASYRDPERPCAQLAEAIRRSQEGRPYYRRNWTAYG